MPATEPDRRLGRLALATLVVAATIRIVAAIVAGVIALRRHDDIAAGRLHVGEVLSAFGAAGDGIGALLAAAAVAVAWWLSRQQATSRAMVSWVRMVVTVTAVMTVVSAVAVILLDTDNNPFSYQLTVIIGFAVAYLVVSLGGLLVLSGLRDLDVAELDPDGPDADGIEPMLFAVDRGNREVFAFFSFAQARRAISSYSVEENEYTFYTDEGRLVNASAHDMVTRFESTDEDHRDELMQALRQFAQAKDLTVEEPQDPTSYAVPIADWQWLELWPGWLRPIGRLVRRIQDSAT